MSSYNEKWILNRNCMFVIGFDLFSFPRHLQFCNNEVCKKNSLSVYSETLPKCSQCVWYLKTRPQLMKPQSERKSGLSFQKWKVEVHTQNWVLCCTAAVDCPLTGNRTNQAKTGACLHCWAGEEYCLPLFQRCPGVFII